MRIKLMRFWSRRSWKAPVVSLPSREAGRLIVTGLGPGGFKYQSKVQVRKFFPDFCEVLCRHGISTRFVTSARQLKKAISDTCVVVHVYPEAIERIDSDSILDAQRGAKLVFNHPLMGPIIGRKDETHRFLTRHGIPMPPMDAEGGLWFSNHVQSSGAPVALIEASTEINRSRYNTKFIDTRVAFDGKEYYTTVRLLCVGRELIHAFVRARDVKDRSLSVHAKDTALIPELLEYLQAKCVVDRMPELKLLSRLLADALGPGFYAHDLLVERDTDRIYVCETGFKFHDWSYPDRIRPIVESLPSHRWMLTPELARKSANAFLAEWRRLVSPVSEEIAVAQA